MSEHSAGPLAHHFEDLEQQHSSATLGMWTFLATEVMFFGGLIGGYAAYRSTSPQAWAAGARQMSVPLGSINTFVLLTSSLTMALAVRAGQLGDRVWQVRYLLLTMVLGTAFLGIKATEYHEEYEKHLVPGLNFSPSELHLPSNAPDLVMLTRRAELFFVFYFTMTGLHALHMIIGLGVVGWIAWLAHRGKFTRDYSTPLEMTGLYWHFIDIVWVFLFPLLYLIDLHK